MNFIMSTRCSNNLNIHVSVFFRVWHLIVLHLFLKVVRNSNKCLAGFKHFQIKFFTPPTISERQWEVFICVSLSPPHFQATRLFFSFCLSWVVLSGPVLSAHLLFLSFFLVYYPSQAPLALALLLLRLSVFNALFFLSFIFHITLLPSWIRKSAFLFLCCKCI